MTGADLADIVRAGLEASARRPGERERVLTLANQLTLLRLLLIPGSCSPSSTAASAGRW